MLTLKRGRCPIATTRRMEEANSDKTLKLLPWHPKSSLLAEHIAQCPAAMLIQEVALTALQAQTGHGRHNIVAFTFRTPFVAIASEHGEILLPDPVDGVHQNRRVPQRGFDEGIRQRGDPPQPLLLTVEVHEEDAALELVLPRPAVVVPVLQGAEFLLVFARLPLPLGALGPAVRDSYLGQGSQHEHRRLD